MTSFSTLDATAQAELVRRGDASALELVDDALARIARLDPALNAVASLDADGARARARGALSGPFAGVPVLAKDLLSVPGQRFSLGARMFAANLARDAFPYVQRMLDAGLIIAGKTTTSELGLLGSTETRLSGVTHNPYDATLSATGSSGGSAAAVAAGMVPMAHASDGGGSIRLPASANGLFGFLPSHGRHVKSGPDDMFGILRDHVLTRSVRDSAGFLRAVEDREADLAPLGPLSGPDRRRLRVAVYEHTVQGESPSGEVRDVLARAARLCGELGHDVRWIDAPAFDGPRLSDAYFTLGGAGIAMLFDQLAGMLGRAPGDAEFEPFTLELAERARRRPPGAVPEALEALRQGARTLNSLLGEHDVVLCPTTPDRTPRLGELSPERDYEALIRRTERFAGYTPIYSFAGAPAMSVPLFTLEGGLPAGCHFAAARGREDVLFALAYELEAALPWAGRWPAVHA